MQKSDSTKAWLFPWFRLVYICVQSIYVTCVCMHAYMCVCQPEVNLKCLSQAPCVPSTFVFVGGTHVCVGAYVRTCVYVRVCVHVCMGERPEVNFRCHLNRLCFFVWFGLFLRQWSHYVAQASHTMPSTGSREGGDKDPCPLR